MSTQRQLIVDIARSQIGVTEIPAGSNRTKYGAWYNLNGQPWCAIFVNWVYVKAGLQDLRQVVTPLWAATWPSTNAAKQKQMWLPTKDALPGDIAMMNFEGGQPIDHTGIVETNNGNSLTLIEGNTSARGSQTNGGAVLRKVRTSNVVGIIRVPQLRNQPVSFPKQPVNWAEVRKYGAAVLLPKVKGLPNLQPGESSENVRILQQALNFVANAGLKEDGVYGDNTIRAVWAFQRFFKFNDKFPGLAHEATRFWLAILLEKIKKGEV